MLNLFIIVNGWSEKKSEEGEKHMTENIGKRILERRRELDMSQETLAEKSKVCRITISRIESGKCNSLLVSTLVAIADALETNVEFFLK